MNKNLKWGIRAVFWATLLWITFAIAQNPHVVRYSVTDWWRLRDYSPSQSISSLAEQAQLSDEAREYFYASLPVLNDKEEFNKNCPFPERTFVLGCYDGDRIYILDVTHAELESAESVTAAHETLHAAWARLKSSEKKRIRRLLNDEYSASTDQHLKDVIASYRESGDDPDEITNELHSILPTEVHDLAPELEEYYSRYFVDRKKVVDLFDTYESVFAANEAKIKELKAELDRRSALLAEDAAELERKRDRVNASSAELSRLHASGNIDAYNARVPSHNALVNDYNSSIRAYNVAVEAYNRLVAEYKDLALRQTDLVHAIDSKSTIEH